MKETRQALAAAQDRRAQIELELVRRQSDLKHLDENCRKELGLPVEEVARQVAAPGHVAAPVEAVPAEGAAAAGGEAAAETAETAAASRRGPAADR